MAEAHLLIRWFPAVTVLAAVVLIACGCQPTSTPEPRAPTADPVVIQAEWEALVALYNATDGANWTRKDNWLSKSPIDDWRGVVTNKDGSIIQLSLIRRPVKRRDTGRTGQSRQPAISVPRR